MTEPGDPSWSEVGGPPKGFKYIPKAKAEEEVSTNTRHEPGPPSHRSLGHMIRKGYPED